MTLDVVNGSVLFTKAHSKSTLKTSPPEMFLPVLHTIAKSSLRSIIPTSHRGISYTAARMAEGDTGGVRSGGASVYAYDIGLAQFRYFE